jgi:hypothetical protein
LLLQPGTYRDYEQGRSNPLKIIEYGIKGRMKDYEVAYENLMRKRQAQRAAASIVRINRNVSFERSESPAN